MPRKPLLWKNELLKCNNVDIAAALTAAIEVRKLEAMRADLKCQHALCIRFDIGEQAGNITELRWV